MQTGGPIFCLTWNAKHRILAAGGMSTVHIFKVDTSDVQKLNQARRAAQLSGRGGRSLTDTKGSSQVGSIIRRVAAALKGPEYSHSDTVKAMVATDAGKLVTGGYVLGVGWHNGTRVKNDYASII